MYLLPADYSALLATEGQTTGYTKTVYNKSVASDGTITFLFVNSHTLNPAATDTVANESIDEKAIGSLPQTGDTAKPLLYGFLALIALVGIGLLIKKK